MRAIIMLEKTELSSYLFQLLTADTQFDKLVLAANIIICQFLLVKVLSIKIYYYYYI